MPPRLRRLLYRHIDFITHTGHAGRKTVGGALYQPD
jgi:hypothetical protein